MVAIQHVEAIVNWEHGDYVRIKSVYGGEPCGWILDMHEDGTVMILDQNDNQRRGTVVGRGTTNNWSPNDYGFHEGRHATIRALRAHGLLP